MPVDLEQIARELADWVQARLVFLEDKAAQDPASVTELLVQRFLGALRQFEPLLDAMLTKAREEEREAIKALLWTIRHSKDHSWEALEEGLRARGGKE